MHYEGWTMREEWVRCGKPGCKSCPHGPYWYGFRREGTRTVKKYFGKRFPASSRTEAASPEPSGCRLDDIFSRRTATVALAAEILGLKAHELGHITVRQMFRKLTLKHHPDRGGDHKTMARINAAFAYLVNEGY